MRRKNFRRFYITCNKKWIYRENCKYVFPNFLENFVLNNLKYLKMSRANVPNSLQKHIFYPRQFDNMAFLLNTAVLCFTRLYNFFLLNIFQLAFSLYLSLTSNYPSKLLRLSFLSFLKRERTDWKQQAYFHDCQYYRLPHQLSNFILSFLLFCPLL